MAQENTLIKSYSLSRMTNFSNVRGVIWLYNEMDAPFARLAFYASNTPTNLIVQDYGDGEFILWAHYPIEAYPDVIDILRNEEPVWLTYEKSMGYARVSSGQEPVGEGEDAA